MICASLKSRFQVHTSYYKKAQIGTFRPLKEGQKTLKFRGKKAKRKGYRIRKRFRVIRKIRKNLSGKTHQFFHADDIELFDFFDRLDLSVQI